MGKISKEWWILLFVILLTLGVGVLEWQKNPPAKQSATSLVNNSNIKMEKEEASVIAAVEYLPAQAGLPEKSNNSNMVFQIALDTHSVNLDDFNFQKDIMIEKDGKSILPKSLNESGGGHHRKAEVTFEKVTPPFIIAVNNLAGVPRREFEFTNL